MININQFPACRKFRIKTLDGYLYGTSLNSIAHDTSLVDFDIPAIECVLIDDEDAVLDSRGNRIDDIADAGYRQFEHQKTYFAKYADQTAQQTVNRVISKKQLLKHEMEKIAELIRQLQSKKISDKDILTALKQFGILDVPGDLRRL